MREDFLNTIITYYREQGRHDLPWRQPEAGETFAPYKILVSEVMLQQTQVVRVIPKYQTFLTRFPSLKALAIAPLSDVLVAWQGLGYNRRAKFLWESAQAVQRQYGTVLPSDQAALVRLPGIGHNTAGAVMAYAFNQPALFIETNIRTVYLHHFFAGQTGVSDKAILGVLDETLDRQNPRVFYWMLMDYGSYLKQTVGNVSRASKGYVKQSKFGGSLRQIRGQVLRLLADGPKPTPELERLIGDDRLAAVLATLEREGLIICSGEQYRLP